MIRISLPYLFTLATTMEDLATIQPEDDMFRTLMKVWGAEQAIHALLNGSVFAPSIRSARESGNALLSVLARVSIAEGQRPEKIDSADALSITYSYRQFKTALLAEIGVFPSYFVAQKGAYDTLSLLDYPASVFPSDLHTKVPEAAFDVSEATRALAFELPTACGFHAFRVIEAVLRRYYDEVTGKKPPPKVRNIAVYVNSMRQLHCGDEKILSSIKQISDLHRNPIIHPEVALTLDEAIATLGMARSATTAMLAVLPTPPQTTETATIVTQ